MLAISHVYAAQSSSAIILHQLQISLSSLGSFKVIADAGLRVRAD
jgi:hypothetical protein